MLSGNLSLLPCGYRQFPVQFQCALFCLILNFLFLVCLVDERKCFWSSGQKDWCPGNLSAGKLILSCRAAFRCSLCFVIALLPFVTEVNGVCADLFEPPPLPCNCYGKDKELRLKDNLRLAESSAGPVSVQVADALLKLGDLFWGRLDYKNVRRLLDRALSITEKTNGKGSAQAADIHIRLSRLYLALNKSEEAEQSAKAALKILTTSAGDDLLRAGALAQLGRIDVKKGRYEAAEHNYKEALSIREATQGKESLEYAQQLEQMSVLFMAAGRLEKSGKFLMSAIPIREKLLGKKHPNVEWDLEMLAQIYCRQGRYEQAVPLLKQVISDRQSTLGTEHPLLIGPLSTCAVALGKLRHEREAERLRRRAAAIAAKQMQPAQKKRTPGSKL